MANGEIIIRIVEGEQQTTQPKTVDVVGTDKINKTKGNLETAAITGVIISAAKSVKQMAASQVSFQINRYFSMTGDYMGQQSLSIASGILSRAAGAATSIAGGFAVAGPAGAAIMAAVEVGKLALDIYHNYSEEAYQLTKMDNQLSFQRQRAGYSLTVGSQGENR